jgi:osmotically-inducible protein OsmY
MKDWSDTQPGQSWKNKGMKSRRYASEDYDRYQKDRYGTEESDDEGEERFRNEPLSTSGTRAGYGRRSDRDLDDGENYSSRYQAEEKREYRGTQGTLGMRGRAEEYRGYRDYDDSDDRYSDNERGRYEGGSGGWQGEKSNYGTGIPQVQWGKVNRGGSKGYQGASGGSSQGNQGEGMYYGRGPKGYKRSDERIEEEANECLFEHSQIDASDIDVKVDSGEVTLSGEVKSRHAKRMAEDAVEKIRGVKDVINQLKVTSSTPHDYSESSTSSKSHTSKEQKGSSKSGGSSMGPTSSSGGSSTGGSSSTSSGSKQKGDTLIS